MEHVNFKNLACVINALLVQLIMLWEVASVLYRTPTVMYHVGLESLGELNMNVSEWDPNYHSYTCCAYRTRGLTPIKLYLINTNFVEVIKTSK